MTLMPERAVLEAISNTEHWAQWARHFGPPSRQGPQIKDVSQRYVFTAFAYGCGLGPTEAAPHLSGAVSADQLAFVEATNRASGDWVTAGFRFIACGIYEATYILDALLANLSELRPARVHTDTHGQSAAVFGLAYPLGIELMPRIRRWHKL
jgi:Tn3 transposase DDE domain